MTLPDERYRAIVYAERFLKELCDPKITPRVPRDVRGRAYSILRHFPSKYHLDVMARESPDVIQERMEDLHKFLLKGKEQQNESGT
jgi:hypothetical protein